MIPASGLSPRGASPPISFTRVLFLGSQSHMVLEAS